MIFLFFKNFKEFFKLENQFYFHVLTWHANVAVHTRGVKAWFHVAPSQSTHGTEKGVLLNLFFIF